MNDSPHVDEVALDSAALADQRQLLLEISKALLTGTLAATRGAIQIIQGLTGVLLASYGTLLVGFGKQLHMNKLSPWQVGLPLIFYIVALLVGLGELLAYKGAKIVIGDLQSGVRAYEEVVAAQRRQLVLPVILLIAGFIAEMIVSARVINMM